MTRSITTVSELDELPVGAGFVDKHGDLGLVDDRDGVRGIQYAETEFLKLSRCALYLPATVVHEPRGAHTAPAPATAPVVSDAAVSRGLAQSAAGETVDLGDFTQYLIPDAAVEAATAAVRREPAFAAAAAFGVPVDSVPQCAEMIARAALTAALPHLGPDGQHVTSGECSHADDCPCFTITPRTDR